MTLAFDMVADMVAEWELSEPVRTDAGMFAIWQPERFGAITDFESWEDEVSEDAALLRHIDAGAFVPIYIGGDGAFQFAVRGGQTRPGLTDREQRYRLVSSEPYLFVSRGSARLGGLEAVGWDDGDFVALPLPPGRYAVHVHLIEWNAEPGAAGPDGKPTANALPDFVIEISNPVGAERFRTSLQTFERPS
ncbi:hypothetical protein [Mycobacterium sp. SP-6446]|uniref:hypothetical protein n=1 Tax=Mycobacterium sp. SP-6446 TaxID=1834162 RepID=UPI00158CED50|nr:hypothetical protein [Mycobacterium sp. SP-6446]